MMDVEKETLYSRQASLLGEDGMRSLTGATVVLSTLNGVGVEIAKNLLLSGLGRLIIHDNCTSTLDFSAQFCLNDASQDHVTDSIDKLKELNESAMVEQYKGELLNVWDECSPNIIVVVNNALNSVLVELNNQCRAHNTKLIVVELYGLCGVVVDDFGKDFVYVHSSGREYFDVPLLSTTQDPENPNLLIVNTLEKLDTSIDGIVPEAWVKFESVEGNTELNGNLFKVVAVISTDVFGEIKKLSFKLDAPNAINKTSTNGRVSRVFVKKTGSHGTIQDFISAPHSFPRDPSKTHTILGIKTLAKFVEAEKRLPTPLDLEDRAKFVALAQEIVSQHTEATPPIYFKEEAIVKFLNTASGSLSPLAAVFGGIAAQEAIKGCTGRYTPISPFFTLNTFDWLYDESLIESVGQEGRYQLQTKIFGQKFQEFLGNLKLCMVGAGAIGCELLKNLAMMGVASGPNGIVHLTDVDDIALSNLHRQFLYKKRHISMKKSFVAASEAILINPNINITPYDVLFTPAAVEIFGGDKFFEEMNIFLPAVDNIDSREFIDSLAAFYNKPMLDSGTEGLSGSSQAILASTGRYMGGQPNALQVAAGCYEKTFPYLAEHTIQMALGRFIELFGEIPRDVMWDITPEEMPGDGADNSQIVWKVSQLEKYSKLMADPNPVAIKEWAIEIFNKLFVENMEAIRDAYPENHVRIVNDIEEPFWNSKVRRPTTLTFDDSNPIHQLFISSTVTLMERILKPSAKEKLSPQEFEKDDSDHVTFLYSLSCLICNCYNIPHPERYKIRYIAGKMSIAIVTSTAIAAGMCCLNLYRAALDQFTGATPNPRLYRNSDFNTAWNEMTVSAPLVATEPPVIEVKCGLQWTVQRLVDELKDLDPYVLRYGSKPNPVKGEDSMLELWRTPLDPPNGAPPVSSNLGDALQILHNKWKLRPFVAGKYIRLRCEKGDCETVTLKLILV